MDEKLATAQALRYAKELRELYASERAQRRRAEEALVQVEELCRTAVRALAAALELRDDETGVHAGRVAEIALRLPERIAPELASDRGPEFGFLLHDLGKIGVPDAILLKPGPLDAEELAVMRRHVERGEQLVSGLPFLDGVAREVIAAHYERWDGTGYPWSLAGEAIPLAARISALTRIVSPSCPTSRIASVVASSTALVMLAWRARAAYACSSSAVRSSRAARGCR